MRRTAVLLVVLAVVGAGQASGQDSALTGFHMDVGEYGTGFKFDKCDGTESTDIHKIRVEPIAEGDGSTETDYQLRLKFSLKPEGSPEDSEEKLLWDELSRHDSITFDNGFRELAQVAQVLDDPSGAPMSGEWYIEALLFEGLEESGDGKTLVAEAECEFVKQ